MLFWLRDRSPALPVDALIAALPSCRDQCISFAEAQPRDSLNFVFYNHTQQGRLHDSSRKPLSKTRVNVVSKRLSGGTNTTVPSRPRVRSTRYTFFRRAVLSRITPRVPRACSIDQCSLIHKRSEPQASNA